MNGSNWLKRTTQTLNSMEWIGIDVVFVWLREQAFVFDCIICGRIRFEAFTEWFVCLWRSDAVKINEFKIWWRFGFFFVCVLSKRTFTMRLQNHDAQKKATACKRDHFYSPPLFYLFVNLFYWLPWVSQSSSHLVPLYNLYALGIYFKWPGFFSMNEWHFQVMAFFVCLHPMADCIYGISFS